MLSWDPLAGFPVLALARSGSDPDASDTLLRELGLPPVEGAAAEGPDLFSATLPRIPAHSPLPALPWSPRLIREHP